MPPSGGGIFDKVSLQNTQTIVLKKKIKKTDYYESIGSEKESLNRNSRQLIYRISKAAVGQLLKEFTLR